MSTPPVATQAAERLAPITARASRRLALAGRSVGEGTVAAAVIPLVLGVVGALVGWRGGDLPAQLYRAGLVDRDGPAVWDPGWFGGHFTPGYSVVFPLLAAAAGVWAAGVGASVVASVSFDWLLHRHRPDVGLAPTVWFASGTAVNLAIGRLTFALGLAVGLLALVAGASRRRGLTGVLTVACPLASPVAGAFLALAWAGWGLAHRRWVGIAAAALALAPVAVLTWRFPHGGSFPFEPGAFVWVTVVALAVVVAVPREERAVRTGAAAYAVASVSVFAIANPLGANVTRLGMFFAGPLLLALAPRRRALLALVVPALLWWQWSPALDGLTRAGRDPSTSPQYYAALVDFLDARTSGPVRVEVPLTVRKAENAYVAEHVMLARGWDRQLDQRHHPLFYDGRLTAPRYEAWLRDNGVRYVALPDAPLDPASHQEAALLREGQPWLRPVWSDRHWQVWEVVGWTGLVDGAARVVRIDPRGVRVQVDEPGELLVRVRWSPWWALEGAGCLERAPGEWVRVRGAEPGALTLRPVLVGQPGPAC